MMRPVLLASLLAPLLGCATTVRLDYTPSPAEVLVTVGDEHRPYARVLTSVLAAERRDGDRDLPYELHLRLRIENLGTDDIALATDDLLLVGGDLQPYGPARIVGLGDVQLTGPIVTAPDDVTTLDAFFTLDDEPHTLGGLNLRFTLQVDGQPLLLATSFERRRSATPSPYGRGFDPYYGYAYGHFGFRRYHCD